MLMLAATRNRNEKCVPDQLSEVANGVYQVRLPLPFALNSVSCYVLRDGDGWVIVDAGLDYEAGRAGWTAAFASLEIAPHAVTRIILTHAHPDHYGMAAWLAQQSGAPISLSAGERAFAERVWISGGYSSSDFVDFFRGYGLPEAEAVQVQRDMVALRAMTGVANTMQVIAAGDVIQIGPRQFAAVSTPGHSDGHLSFYCADERLMLSGDAVLSKITPNIGLWPGG